MTIAFSIHVAQSGNHTATYASLSAVLLLLPIWLYRSGYILVLDAVLNAVFERLATIGSDAEVRSTLGGGASSADPGWLR